MPVVYLNKKTLQSKNLADEMTVEISSPQGKLKARVKLDDRVGNNMIMIYQGWWHKSGSVNFLTKDTMSQMGEQAAYYDCFCRIDNTPAD